MLDRRLAVPFTLAGLLACSNGTGPDPNRICTAPVRVTATNSTTPAVTWSPQCHVNELVFHEPDIGLRALWVLLDPGRGNPIISPVQYGVVPAGATEQAPAQPMTAGRTYIVDLWVTDSTALFAMFVGSDTIVPSSLSGRQN